MQIRWISVIWPQIVWHLVCPIVLRVRIKVMIDTCESTITLIIIRHRGTPIIEHDDNCDRTSISMWDGGWQRAPLLSVRLSNWRTFVACIGGPSSANLTINFKICSGKDVRCKLTVSDQFNLINLGLINNKEIFQNLL